MASILDLVKHYQHAIEKYPNDEQKILKCIDKLFNLGVTVQHLQETGVGRTVNALRKEPGEVGQAARALVYKWKLMVAAEENDHDEDNSQTTQCNGHENGRTPEDSDSESKHKSNHYDYNKTNRNEENYSNSKHMNGNYNEGKRKCQSSEEEEPHAKKSRHIEVQDKKSNLQVKREQYENAHDSHSDSSHSEDSGSEDSESSREVRSRSREQKPKIEIIDKHRSSSTKHSSHSSQDNHKREERHVEKHSKQSHSESRHTSEKSSKHKSSSSDKHKKDKDNNSSHKEKLENKSSDKEKKKTESKEDSSSKSRSSSDKHKSSSHSDKTKSREEKSSSKSETHSSSHKHKSEKDKQKHSSEKSGDKHKSREHSSSKDNHSSSSRDKVKDKSSSSKDKENSHKSDKKHSSLSETNGKEIVSRSKSEKSDSKSSSSSSKEKKSHSSSSHSSKSSKSSSSKSKDTPKKKPQKDNSEDSEDGIDCGSGASFAEALGMISPSKPKKKSASAKENSYSPNNSGSDDMTPAALLAPSARLAPLPSLEISALPEISPHYKPRPPPRFLPHFTDEDAISAGISSKNQRTKVYSGNKVLGKIPSLYEMCVQILQEHIDALEYTGGVPYEILKPVVDKATPQQLYMLEHFNPYLMDDTDHLWQKFCEKNFRNKKRQELETWREMYMRCQEEQEHRLKSLTANIKIAQEAKKAPIKQTKMAYVDSVVKPPRNVARKQAQHGTAFTASASPAARVAALAAAPNVLKGGRAAPLPPAPSSTAFQKPKKAPLMQKALQFMRGRKR